MNAKKMDLSLQKFENIQDVLDHTSCTWTAEPMEMITSSGATVEGKQAIVRSDQNKVIGVVGNRYYPIQNHEAFAFMDVICREHNAKYDYLYEIDDGSQIIVQASMGRFEVKRQDELIKYITLINSFNGTKPLMAYFTTVRLWCNNQLSASIREATNCVKLRHTKKNSVSELMVEAKRVFSLSEKYFSKFEETLKLLEQKFVDRRMIDTFLDGVFGGDDPTLKKNIRVNNKQKVLELFENGHGNRGKTLWDLVNGVTEYIDHHRGSDEEKRLASSMVGNGFNTKSKMFNVALKLL